MRYFSDITMSVRGDFFFTPSAMKALLIKILSVIYTKTASQSTFKSQRTLSPLHLCGGKAEMEGARFVSHRRITPGWVWCGTVKFSVRVTLIQRRCQGVWGELSSVWGPQWC